MRNCFVLALLVPTLCGPLLGCGARSIGSGLDEDDGGADTAAADGAVKEDVTILPGEDAITPGDAIVPPTDGGVIIDVGTTDVSPPADASVRCGTKVCDGLTQDCCLTAGSGGGSATCIVKGGTCGGGVALGCTSSAGCPSGQVCCLTISGTSGGKAVCTTTCAGGPPGPGGGSVTLCTTDADCPTGLVCRGIGAGIRGCLRPGGPGGGGGGTPPPPPDGG